MNPRWRKDWGGARVAAGSPVRRLVQESECKTKVACARLVAAEIVSSGGMSSLFFQSQEPSTVPTTWERLSQYS